MPTVRHSELNQKKKNKQNKENYLLYYTQYGSMYMLVYGVFYIDSSSICISNTFFMRRKRRYLDDVRCGWIDGFLCGYNATYTLVSNRTIHSDILANTYYLLLLVLFTSPLGINSAPFNNSFANDARMLQMCILHFFFLIW